MNFEQELQTIKNRNALVEVDKAWEVSKTRTALVMFTTYVLVVLFLFVIKNERPFINALVPPFGFLLSTQSLSFVKKLWVKKIYNSSK